MSPSVAGFVAVSASIADDEYVFDSAITVQPGRYWFYTNDQTTSSLITSDGLQDLYPDGELYVASVGDRFAVMYTTREQTDRRDANFRLRGRPVQ